MLSHPLTNFEIQKQYPTQPRFNGVYSRNNSPKIKDGTYVINRDKYESAGTHWIALHVNDDNGESSNDVAYFNSFGVEYIPKRLKSSLAIEISQQIFLE